MAKIIKKDDSLKKKYGFYRKLMLIGGGLFAAGFISFAVNLALSLITPPLFIVGFVCCLAGIGILSVFGGKTSALKVGIKGERATARLIERLPESYFGIQNTVVAFEGKQSELDLVVVGPTGVFIIESKSRNGRITGDYDAKYWTQHKIGRGGTPYSSDFYSPIKQVGTHVYRLAHFLRSRGAQVNIEGAVYMSGEDFTLSLSGARGRIPVFTSTPEGQKGLYSYIFSGKASLTTHEIARICNIIIKG